MFSAWKNEEIEFIKTPELTNSTWLNEKFVDFLSSTFEKTSSKNQNDIQTFLKLSSTAFPKIGDSHNTIKNSKSDTLE